MTYRRRAGRRFRRRQKVSREELVKFYKGARSRELIAQANRRAERLARWLRRGAWVVAIAAILFLVWREL